MKPGRNDACPCGSGLKFKKCCLQQGAAAAVGEAVAAEAATSAPAEPRQDLPRVNTWDLLHKQPAGRGPSQHGRKKPK